MRKTNSHANNLQHITSGQNCDHLSVKLTPRKSHDHILTHQHSEIKKKIKKIKIHHLNLKIHKVANFRISDDSKHSHSKETNNENCPNFK